MTKSRHDIDGALSPREHARLAKFLIRECGGLAEATRACGLSDSTLSRYQTNGSGQFMPADVIANLEGYCGKPVYSGALFDLFDSAVVSNDLRDATCALTEAAAKLQGAGREALADGRYTMSEDEQLAALEAQAEDALSMIKATRRGLQAGIGQGLRTVA